LFSFMRESEYLPGYTSSEREQFGFTIFSPLSRWKAVAVASNAIRRGVGVEATKVPDEDDPFGRTQVILIGSEKQRAEVSRMVNLPHPSPASSKNR
jgi:hypothetical protein